MHNSAQQIQTSRRKVARVVKGMPTSDGAGVRLTRVIAQPALPMLDPFLLLDAFRSDQPGDYIAGFPPHPHRGFETVTYLLAGRMRHRDSTGREGVIESGGVQWMTAGRGIVHSEMPEQEHGLLEGFQLWVNLPADNKMDAPGYQEYPAAQIPVEQRDSGILVHVIAGETSQGTRGPVAQPLTEPLYLDVELPANTAFSETLPRDHNAFIYVIDGEVDMHDMDDSEQRLGRDSLAVLSHGDEVAVATRDQAARVLLVAGKPLNEPVARGGPFVMNTKAQIREAYEDYEAGRF
ncbi:pirin family protein [Thiosocius teredinicola]|uniref:pirin family protein n=1 Tax=Thiosocius teredinicola TaxID=1973002 RepID=UPI0009914E5D